MPDGFAKDLKTAIRSGKFHTFTSLPLIGGGGSLWLYGIESKSHGAYAARLMEIGSSDLGDDTSDGWHVLVSLYNEETKAANRIICKWITEFLKDKNKAK
jgi:hypothetical protein